MNKVDSLNNNPIPNGAMMGGMPFGMPNMPTPPPTDASHNVNGDGVVDLSSSDVKDITEEEKVETTNSTETNSESSTELSTEVNNEEDEKARTIRSATPYIINTNKKDNMTIATLSFLCVLENDKIITICRNFLIHDEDEEDILKLIDFHADSEFINNKICYNFIAKYLPSYFSAFNFKANPKEDKNLVTLECVNITNRSEMINFRMTSETYVCMSFIDDYVFKGEVENTYDLSLATVAGSKKNDNIEFFVVESVEDIISMVSTAQKPKGLDALKNLFSKDENTGIGIVFRVSRTVDGNKETVSILTPFDIGVSLDKSKFKGDTIESIQENYYGDADQYVSTLLIDEVHLYDIDKDYMVIRGKNKSGKYYVFLLDNNMKQKLIHDIKAY